MDAARHPVFPPAVAHLLGSARFASALTLCILGAAFSTHLLRATMGWPGLLAILVALVALATLSLLARRQAIDWYGLPPITLLVFLGWTIISVFWSTTTVLSGARVLYLLLFTALGVYLTLVRDTIQLVRGLGDVLRVLLGVSLALEVLSGVLLDLPIVFLDIQGNLTSLGPLQGIFGSRNQLGLIALIALITFSIEYMTRSVPRMQGAFSIGVATLCVLLSGSPVTMGAFFVVGLAALALAGIRRVPSATRMYWQLGLLTLVAITAAVLWLTRSRILELLNAGSEFEARIAVWREIMRYSQMNTLQGWGWVGAWPPLEPPYVWINLATRGTQNSGLSAFYDVYFQLGIVGLISFSALIGFALVRSWLLASEKRSSVYVWPALIVVALTVTSFAESTVLGEYGWMLLIVCAIKASQSMSWRDALRRHEPEPVPKE